MLQCLVSLKLAQHQLPPPQPTTSETPEPSAHIHTYASEWASDDNYHWHAATCEHIDEIADKAKHSWKITVITMPTLSTEGELEYNCTGCNKTQTEITKAKDLEMLGKLYSISQTEERSISNGTYVTFGTWPQTIKSPEVIIDEDYNITQGSNNYFLGSDGEWYAKVCAKPFKKYTSFTNGQSVTKDENYYFKVEPIVWRVLATDGEKLFLFSEKILTSNIPYYYSLENRTLGGEIIYPNNYKYSAIRAYLNGLENQFVTDGGNDPNCDFDWTGKGLLQTAFSETQQSIIINSICEDVNDKIFLLSEEEATSALYDFPINTAYGDDSPRLRKPTDYAVANYAYQEYSITQGGFWWLRSPCSNYNIHARDIFFDGICGDFAAVTNEYEGIVPALWVNVE